MFQNEVGSRLSDECCLSNSPMLRKNYHIMNTACKDVHSVHIASQSQHSLFLIYNGLHVDIHIDIES